MKGSSANKQFCVCIVYPADPVGIIPGGIDTFLRGILRWAPDDIRMHVVGVTTDNRERPVGRWTTCSLEGRSFEFYSLIHLGASEKQAKMPVTLRFLAALLMRKPHIPGDVLEFHRIEPCLAFLRDGRSKTLVMHQNMNILRHADSDIRWRYVPGLYFRLEAYLFPRMRSVYCVRADAAESYRKQYPALADRIYFTPTWVDTGIFQPPTDDERRECRLSLREELGFGEADRILLTVGRLDRQKSPLMLLDAFARVHRSKPDVCLLFVGDGVLRHALEARIARYDLQARVRLCGVRPPGDIARYLRSSDIFVLSSAYEGMPMSVLESLGCGLPVVSTDVGEVSRVVKPGHNGELIESHDPEVLAAAILRCLKSAALYRGRPCSDAVANYTPQKVLAPFYDNYRRLAEQARSQP